MYENMPINEVSLAAMKLGSCGIIGIDAKVNSTRRGNVM